MLEGTRTGRQITATSGAICRLGWIQGVRNRLGLTVENCLTSHGRKGTAVEMTTTAVRRTPKWRGDETIMATATAVIVLSRGTVDYGKEGGPNTQAVQSHIPKEECGWRGWRGRGGVTRVEGRGHRSGGVTRTAGWTTGWTLGWTTGSTAGWMAGRPLTGQSRTTWTPGGEGEAGEKT